MSKRDSELLEKLMAALLQEIEYLRDLGHEHMLISSSRLKQHLPDYEAWFESGLELKRSSERLREMLIETSEKKQP